VPSAVAAVISDRRVAAVTFTGSDRSGSEVGAAAGRALKKSVLELGGSDPFIVLRDANVAQAVKGAVTARYLNAGQSCASPKRLIIDQALIDDFVPLLIEAVEEIVIGDPLESETTLGPLARADLREVLDRQVQSSVTEGASVLAGGSPLDRRGYFYAPTVVTGVSPQMTIAQEEVFGPVAVVLAAENENHAFQLANETSYGLAASIWTSDIDRAERRVNDIESGCVFINGIVASDPRLPFGGTKRSGYGRELGAAGIREFTNLRTVWLAPTSQ
jgi:succinate-semialdehyde dehydrogenase/glutarate-semialdehyde dehydrogenase